MGDELKPEDRALIESVMGACLRPYTANDVTTISIGQLAALLEAARAQGPAPGEAVADGWVMVPREPTEAMTLAGAALWLGGGTVHAMSDSWHERMRLTFAAMIAATPREA